jgi:hypothetical protein
MVVMMKNNLFQLESFLIFLPNSILASHIRIATLVFKKLKKEQPEFHYEET